MSFVQYHWLDEHWGMVGWPGRDEEFVEHFLLSIQESEDVVKGRRQALLGLTVVTGQEMLLECAIGKSVITRLIF